MSRIGVLGATSWGVTLAGLLAKNGHTVVVLCRSPEEAAAVARRRGIARMAQVVLPPGAETGLVASPGPLDGCVLAAPSQSLAANLAASALDRGTPVLNVAKGIELASGRRLSEVIAAAGWDAAEVAVLSGPNLAHEVAAGQPAAAVVASARLRMAEWWQLVVSGPTFRCYRSGDVTGVEIGGASKNVIAIAAGAAGAMGLGSNMMAALVTRGLAEMTRLTVALGGDPETMRGLAGVGDLMATCFSSLSRNHRLGALLASGLRPGEALARIGEAVEGAATAPALVAMAQRAGAEMPITEEVAAVLAGERDVAAALERLLRPELAIESR
jgi:glycerol-3-phosphate dehydrogenase (NAD(P)+)